ncbi:MAG: FAD:protein FMN transferase [Christensenella sp.]
MKRIFGVMLIAFCLTLVSCAPACETNESFAMNTIITQTVYTSNTQVISQNNQIIRDIENKMSKTIPTSDIGKLNHRSGENIAISSETAQVLHCALIAAADTDGAFSPALGGVIDAWGFDTENAHVPDSAELEKLLSSADYRAVQEAAYDANIANAGGALIDLGGAVKGYALDMLAQNLSANNVSSAILSLGGSIYATGKKPDNTSYKIGIRDPYATENDYMAVISTDGVFVSTSGIYERGFTENGKYYHHIIDPKTGFPVENGLAAVTVIADSGIMSDIYSTALFVMGAERGVAFAEAHGADALFLTSDRQIITTAGFAKKYDLQIKGQWQSADNR